jgi:hypothetical protein
MIAPLEAAHEINRPLNKSSLFRSSAVYQISRGTNKALSASSAVQTKKSKISALYLAGFAAVPV